MLTIREEQMEVFEEVALQKFEDDMVAHVKVFAPKRSASLADDVIREVVQMGIERAKEYGLTNRGPVRFFIEMVFMFGSEFDTDPQYPWAGAVLNDAQTPDQMERAARLYTKTKDYTAKVAGPERKYQHLALQRLRAWNYQGLRMSEQDHEGNVFEADMIADLKSIYPEKCEYAGEPAIREVVRQAVMQTEEYAFLAPGAQAVLGALMFFLGHQCFFDPQFPWIESTLIDEGIVDDAEKARLLHSKLGERIENEVRE